MHELTTIHELPDEQLAQIVRGVERERQRVLTRVEAVEHKFDARIAAVEKQRKLAMADDVVLLEFYRDLLDELERELDARIAAGEWPDEFPDASEKNSSGEA